MQSLPDGYEIIARRDSIAIDGMQHTSLPLWSFQFHPEAGTDFARTSGIDPTLLSARQRTDSHRLLSAFRSQIK